MVLQQLVEGEMFLQQLIEGFGLDHHAPLSIDPGLSMPSYPLRRKRKQLSLQWETAHCYGLPRSMDYPACIPSRAGTALLWPPAPLLDPRSGSLPEPQEHCTGVHGAGATNEQEEPMATELNGQKIAFLMAQEGVEEVELTEPWEAVERAGGRPELVAPADGEVQAFQHLDKASRFTVDKSLEEARAQDYASVVLPGGVANPDQLRTDQRAIDFLREVFSEGKPVG